MDTGSRLIAMLIPLAFIVLIVASVMIAKRASKRDAGDADEWFPSSLYDGAESEMGTRFKNHLYFTSSRKFTGGVFADPSLGDDTRVGEGIAYNVVKGYPVFAFRYGWYRKETVGDVGEMVPCQAVLSAVATGGQVPRFSFELANPEAGNFNEMYLSMIDLKVNATGFVNSDVVAYLAEYKPLRFWSEPGGWVFCEWRMPVVSDPDVWPVVLDNMLLMAVGIVYAAPSRFIGKPLTGAMRETGMRSVAEELFPGF